MVSTAFWICICAHCALHTLDSEPVPFTRYSDHWVFERIESMSSAAMLLCCHTLFIRTLWNHNFYLNVWRGSPPVDGRYLINIPCSKERTKITNQITSLEMVQTKAKKLGSNYFDDRLGLPDSNLNRHICDFMVACAADQNARRYFRHPKSSDEV